MKTNKTITLNVELANKLRGESNASGLIEQLLIEHYQHKDYKSMTRDEKKVYLKAQIDEHSLAEKYKKALKRIKNGTNRQNKN